MCLQLFRPELEALTKSVTYVLFVFSRNRPQKRKRTFFSVWRLNRSFESVCLPCWLESCWSRSLLLSCSSPSLLNAHSYKNVGVYCRCVASRPPCGRWGVCSVHTHIHRKHMHTHFLMLKRSHTNAHRHTHRFSRFQFKSVALTLYTHTHVSSHSSVGTVPCFHPSPTLLQAAEALGGFWFCVWRLGVSAGGPAARQTPPRRLIICHLRFLLIWIFVSVLKRRSGPACSPPAAFFSISANQETTKRAFSAPYEGFWSHQLLPQQPLSPLRPLIDFQNLYIGTL